MADYIRMADVPVRFARATCEPEFQERRVIASSPWEFVSLWLRKNGHGDAKAYWDQAKHFFDSARELPAQSAPLPLYYSFLNATKALLEVKGQSYGPLHGVTGFDLRRSQANARIQIDNEGLKIKGGGVLPALTQYFRESETATKYTLADVFSNLPFIHRAYALSYSKPELYLSLVHPRYVREPNRRARFQADLPEEHCRGQTRRTLPAHFCARELTDQELDEWPSDSGWVLESEATFPWSGSRRATAADRAALVDFHRSIRLDIQYIAGAQPNWYVKRSLASYRNIRRNNLTLMFMAMHRMSEIARYKPLELNRLLGGRRNWILYEFTRVAQNQFIDEIAAEITGYEISPAGVRQSTF
jgi:hypothetical protein